MMRSSGNHYALEFWEWGFFFNVRQCFCLSRA